MPMWGFGPRGGSSRLQREGPKPANADVIQAHQVYIVGHYHKVRFRKGAKPHFGPPRPEFGPVGPLDPPTASVRAHVGKNHVREEQNPLESQKSSQDISSGGLLKTSGAPRGLRVGVT